MSHLIEKDESESQEQAVALITGATGGIGYATALALAKKNYRLLLTGRDAKKLKDLAHDIKQQYDTDLETVVVDLTQSSAIKPLFQIVQKRFSRLDTLIHCAGTLSQAPLMMVQDAQIDEQLTIHLKTSLLLSQLASRLMMRNKADDALPSLIFISSIVAEQGGSGQALYASAKAGLQGLVKSLAKELGSQGIRVNAVSPGFIETELVDDYKPEQRALLTQQTCLKRLGQASDVADTIQFLAGADARYITGQTIAVDGGLVLTV